MKINKQKIFEIILTALISAGIAFLQNLLTHLAGLETISNSPEIAGGIGAVLSALKKSKV